MFSESNHLMEIPSKTVYDVLVEKGVDTLYHANSVITSCQFLRNGALLSRGTVARNGWYQTPQSSDKTDRSQRVKVEFDVEDLAGEKPSLIIGGWNIKSEGITISIL